MRLATNGPHRPQRSVKGAAAGLVASLFVSTSVLAGGRIPTTEFDLTRRSVPESSILRGGPPKDGIPSIDQPQFVAAGEADFLSDDDRVVVVSLDGNSKAYPLRILDRHEAVNDTLGAALILVTYCPLTDSARVFRRPTAGDPSFGISGLLYEGNLLLYDRATESLWSQLGAAAVAGPRTGERLEVVPSVVTIWGSWGHARPDTMVLSTGQSAASRDAYAEYRASEQPMFVPTRQDLRLPLKSRVLGVRVGSELRAYPYPALARGAAPIQDRLGGASIEIVFDGHEAHVSSSSTDVEAIALYWFAWFAFHPETTVWGQARDEPSSSIDERIRVETASTYWTGLLGGESIAGPGVGGAESGAQRGDLFVFSGTLRNVSSAPLHHVRIAFELFRADGEVLFRQDGYNYGAEGLAAPAGGDSIVPLAPGAQDRFRTVLLGSDLPPFERAAARVVGTTVLVPTTGAGAPTRRSGNELP